MNTSEFLRAILPPDCWYFVVTPAPGGKGFKHYPCQTIEEAAQRALYLDSEHKQNVFYACAGYRESHIEKIVDGKPKQRYRTKENVKLVKSFWLDLDVGTTEPGQPPKYATQADAVAALGRFLAATKLPVPIVVNSGYGVHCYWPLTQPILPGQWTHTAGLLKALTGATKLMADNSRTSDEASILRPVGTHNRKVKNGVAGAMPVSSGSAVQLFDYQAIHHAIEFALKLTGTEAPAERKHAAAEGGVNPSGLVVPVGGFQKSSPDRIASMCQQIHALKETGGVSEPQWYAALQVVAFAENGEKTVHDWSAKYPSYTFDETQRKIDQVLNFGPTTCAKLDDVYPEGCRGCKYKGKITSPIQLGIEVKAAAAPTVTVTHDGTETLLELPMPPAPFLRGGDDMPGLYVDIEGVPVRFYPYDLFPVELCKDTDMGYETTRVRHWLPHEGWCDYTFRSSLIVSHRDFTTSLMDNSIKPENAKFMAAYMNSYLQELQSKTKIRKLYGAMGWQDDDGFLLGRKLYTKAGEQAAGVSNKVSPELIDGIATAGTLADWQAGIKLLDRAGLEAHLFSFLIGFGAPLFAVTGYDGAMLSMLGDTNSGKTLSSKAMLSIYGKYKGLRIGKKDTLNAKIEKMSMLGNLPVYIDELTNTEANELSQFIYQVSEGRGRARLRSDSSMRAAASWQTLGVTSTNASLTSKLATSKDNAEAEMVRLLEYRVERIGWFEKEMSTVHEAVTANYGHAGEAYVRWLVQSDRNTLREQIENVAKSIRDTVSFEGRERYWINTIAVVLYGAVAAQAIGVLNFDNFPATYARLFNWATGLIRSSRTVVSETRQTELTVLSQFLDSIMSNRLVVNDTVLGHIKATTVVKPPMGPLVARYEQHTGNIYVDRKVLRKYLSDHQIDYNPMKNDLLVSGVLKDAGARKVLGAGTQFTGGQVDTWLIDGRHPALAGVLEVTPTEGEQA